jgi:alginate O-acetyltransferase complex protein AlgI
MVFSSIEFLWLFMPVVLALYALVPPRWRNALLAALSVVFYAWGAHSLVVLSLLAPFLPTCIRSSGSTARLS